MAPFNPKKNSEDPIIEDPSREDKDDGSLEDERTVNNGARLNPDKNKFEIVFERLSKGTVSIRVHDVIIEGNSKTKDTFIEAEVEALKNATSVQELLQAASLLNARLHSLEIFDAVNIILDSGPPELPNTANVIVQVVEAKNPLAGNFGIFTKPETRSWTLEGTLKLRNLFGYGDIWDVLGSFGWDQASELSAGVTLPRFRGLSTPSSARISLLSQDWMKMSSYKERLMGLSLGLYSTTHHDLSYTLGWRTLTDPSQMASKSVRMQLGHSLLSSLKYTFRIDNRDSSLRPTRGWAFASNTQIAGLTPDSRSLRFLRQEFDLRFALPLGFYRAALNFGLSAGVMFPWGSGFMNRSLPISERFFLGGQSSSVCTLGGPTTLLGFKTRGLGPSEPRRVIVGDSGDESAVTSPERDFLGGDLALTAFADLSFNLPLKLLTDAGIHGHVFGCTGNLTKLSKIEFGSSSLKKFGESFRSTVGAGVIIPTKLFRMEINYCYIMKQLENDRGKTGIQFSFSA